MTRFLFWVVKHPKITVIIMLSLITTVGGYMAYNAVTISDLRARVATLEQTVASKDDQITELKGSLETQNAAVDRWQAEAEARQQAAAQAVREARVARQKADEAVGRLQATVAQTCEEGIELINRDLWQ